ncbi:phage terminase small subunit [Caldibacillus lycopersici]|uniref:Phage terminase small subunit n=1 Tax=Perspicuibacillus lycopersici TaxID=1325689 RepID=A0AAE3LTJ8_9BACI|nr:phage terminase small subunit [Perspicuibacillus lycopersici]MCU9614098.1 phage terminase small subunit [Perspicuibacillus lycopersici]
MARPRNPKREEAFEIWKNSDGKKKLKDIAGELELSDSQIRKWKNEDQWDKKLKSNVTNSKSNVTKRTRGAPKGNQNAIGNEGGAPKGNQNAVTHGLFSKYIPPETLELMGMLEEKNPADLIWDQIMIQYAAIIRAQKIMFVTDKYEMIKELKKEKQSSSQSGSSWEEEHEFQFAWDRQATFLNAQSRAMSELRSLIKQFNDLAHENDERRLKLEQMSLNIEKTKAEVKTLSKTEDKGPLKIIVDYGDEE